MSRFYLNAFGGVLCLLFSLNLQGTSWQKQPVQQDPPPFTVTFSKNQAKVGDIIVVSFTAKAPKPWYIYSTNGDCFTGPQKAELSLEVQKGYKPIGGLTSSGDKVMYDDIFKCSIGKFEDRILFKQKIQILSADFAIKGFLMGQMCNDNIGICINFESPDLAFPTLQIEGDASSDMPPPSPPLEINPAYSQKDPWAKDSMLSLPPNPNVDCDDYRALLQRLDRVLGHENPLLYNEEPYVPHYRYQKKSEDDTAVCHRLEYDGYIGGVSKNSLWGFFLLALISGFAALITPCVFPMIPMTVAFFMKGSEKKSKSATINSGLLFGLSIIGIYTVVGSLVGVTVGPDAANFLATHWIPNVFFFLVFMVFAAAFFGAFELVLPSWIVNKVDKQADKGGLAGIFFMALTLALVSFSCTGPIVGMVLVESAKGDFLKPVIGMLGFSLAFALPFALFAMFPGWLNRLPKSGGWLNAVKVTLGFIELALGLKFLSLADQTHHWGILDREVYLALWIVIFTLMGVYLLGKLKFAHDSDFNFLKVPRLILAVITFSFVIYLIPGMFGAPLKALAGYLPPMATHDFPLLDKLSGPRGNICEEPKYAESLHLPHNLRGYFDYEQGMACAKKLNKPVFIDFTGFGCVNCREMEARVWSDDRVLKLLSEEFVIIALYVDDKWISLPEEEHYISKNTGRKITTLSRKNSDIQACLFGSNAQPNYVLLDHEETLLNHEMQHDLKVENFIAFLKTGVRNYQKKHASRKAGPSNTSPSH
jgi:cytochrome c biogenesis protein CcdA/thioredoxin-related protein